jgi:hypothetical protein
MEGALTRTAFIAAAAALLTIFALSTGPADAAPHKKGVTVPSASAAVPLPLPRPVGPTHADNLPTLC